MQRMAGYIVLTLLVSALVTNLTVEGSRIHQGELFFDANTALNLGPGRSVQTSGPIPFTSCDIARDNCGSITPQSISVFIADGAYNSVDGTIFYVDVPVYTDGTFQFDPVTCTVVSGTYYSINYGQSQRGIAFDEERYQIWVGDWGGFDLNQYEATPPYERIAYNYVGLAIASDAIDQANDYLFAATNASPDALYAFDISSGSLGDLLGSWPVPWQSPSDGYDMAGLSFDDDSGQLIMVNQYAGGPGTTREAFDFDITTGLTPAGYCTLDNTSFSWGIGLIEDGDPVPGSYSTYHPDIYTFAPPFDVDEYGIPAVYPPYDLLCSVTAERNVELSWTNGDTYTSVNIYRNGELLETLAGAPTSYVDVDPGVGVFDYGVTGVIGPDESSPAQCRVNVYPDGQEVCFDFNDTDGGWTAGGYADFEWGSPSYVIDGNAWETNLGVNYYNGSCGWLDSPAITLGDEGGWLTFDSYNYVETYYDGWNIQMSTDGGTSWSMMYPVEGYDQGEPYSAQNCPEGLGGDTNAGYGEVETWNFNLTSYPNTTLWIRFLFESDSSVAYTGLVIDNVCMYGGSVPSVLVQCQLLNPDDDGDGVRDVHLGDFMYWSATFINMTGSEVEYGAMHSFYAAQSCPDPDNAVDHFGPECKGVLEGYGVATHYYIVHIPDYPDLVYLNPFAWEVEAWQCEGGVPQFPTGVCCMDVMLLPGWEPPPVPEPMDRFVVEEIDFIPFTQ